MVRRCDMTDGFTDSWIGKKTWSDYINKCSVKGCKRPLLMLHNYKGYCSYHYDKFVKLGKIKEPKQNHFDFW